MAGEETFRARPNSLHSNKLALASGLLPAVSGLVEMKPGQWGGLDTLMAASASAPGLPYLTEVTLTFEGSSQIGRCLEADGSMKMIQKVVSLSTDAVSDDLFQSAGSYTIMRHVAPFYVTPARLAEALDSVRQQRGRFSNARVGGEGAQKRSCDSSAIDAGSSPMSQRADFATMPALFR
jgi:hypothetical protein